MCDEGSLDGLIGTCTGRPTAVMYNKMRQVVQTYTVMQLGVCYELGPLVHSPVRAHVRALIHALRPPPAYVPPAPASVPCARDVRMWGDDPVPPRPAPPRLLET